jgi:hypothetical protein
MKTCGKCKIEKTLESFSWRNKAKGTKLTWCKLCMSEYDRTRYTTTNRPVEVRANTLLLRKRNVEWLDAYLSDKACVDCGITDRRVLQFDHRDRATKVANLSNMSYSYGLDAIMAEVAKCDVRCANCHMIRTGEQLGWRTAI